MSILRDIRFGSRILVKSPGFTLAAVVAIALGIGVNSMMFTIYNAALFKTLPFENPRQIVHIHSRNLAEGWDRRGVFYEDFLEYRAQARSFEGLAAFMNNGYTTSDERGAPHLIVDQRSAGERKKSAQLSDIIFLIGSDESADCHVLRASSPFAQLCLSNRFRARPKMIDCRSR